MSDVPAPNPLASMMNPQQAGAMVANAFSSGYANQHARMENALLQQKLSAQNALSNYVATNTDENGNINYPAIVAQASQDPNATPYLNALVESAQVGSQAQTKSQTDAAALSAAQLSRYQNTTAGALTDLDENGNVKLDNVVQAIRQHVAWGDISPQRASSELTSVAQMNPQQLTGYTFKQYLAAQPAQSQMDYVSGKPVTISNGGQTFAGTMLPSGQLRLQPVQGPAGVVSGQGGIVNTASPDRMVGSQTYKTPGGVDVTAPTMTPTVPVYGPSAPPRAPNGAAPNGGNMLSDSDAVAKPSAIPNVGLTPAAPGSLDAAAVDQKAGAEQGVTLQQSADQAPARKAALNNMLGDLQNFTSGPSADNAARLKALALGWGLNAPITAQGTAAQEEFAKLGKQIALAQAGSLGVATDEKLNTTMGANPNTSLSKLGNQQIIGMLKGNEDAIAAKNQAWQAYKQQNGAGSYSQFSTQFNKNFDPRVFQMQYMDAGQKADLRKQVKNDPRFLNALSVAHNSGWISPNGQ